MFGAVVTGAGGLTSRRSSQSRTRFAVNSEPLSEEPDMDRYVDAIGVAFPMSHA
jgi:hypothetical protein